MKPNGISDYYIFISAETRLDLKALLVNADDLGMSEKVNSAIINAYEEGIVRSASLIYNPRTINSVAELVNNYPKLTIGYHANLTFGRPVLSRDHVKSLINSNNDFYSKWEFAYRYFSSKINKQEIYDELEAQIKNILDHGIHLAHIDGHHHVHCLPGLDTLLCRLAKKYDITRIRKISRPFTRQCSFASIVPYAQHRLLSTLKSGYGNFKGTDYFFGFEFFCARNKKKVLLEILGMLPIGTTEFMCHPLHYKDLQTSKKNQFNQTELAILCDHDVKLFIQRSKIRLVNS